MARAWLAKARKRQTFAMLVESIIQNNMASACILCNNPPSGGIDGRRLTVSLATAGEPNVHAIGRLISGFEDAYGTNNRDEYLWKAYFRSNAKYVTTCNKCSTIRKAHQDENSRQMKRASITAASMLGKERQQTRAVDISSDEEEEDENVDDEAAARFEAVRVTHNSPVGRTMSKWLSSARNKMGGVDLFPKEEAKAYVESYLESLGRFKLRESKEDDFKSGGSGTSALQGTGGDVTTKQKVGTTTTTKIDIYLSSLKSTSYDN